MQTLAEENYLKSIYHLQQHSPSATTSDIAALTNTKAASVTDMLKKLADKQLINYARYQGVSLTPAGEKVALGIIRNHRLWEYFLVEKLKFKWDEVHELAEQLEHISSVELVNRLDEFMGCPRLDPHGDPIPDAEGKIHDRNFTPAIMMKIGQAGTLAGVNNHTTRFLQYLEKLNLTIGQCIKIKQFTDYDLSINIGNNKKLITISREVAQHLLIAL